MIAAEPLCARCEGRLERGDLRCPVCHQVAPEAMMADRPRVVIEVLRCSGCGAAVTYDARSRSPRCAFCGSETRVEAPRDPPEQIEQFLPFTVDRSAAEAAFRRWIKGLGWFRPSALETSTLETFQSSWWVGWVCNATALVSWTVDSDADTRRAEWAPHAGQEQMELRDLIVSASRGLSLGETAALVPGYDLDSARARAEGAGDDAVIEQFDVLRAAARRHVEHRIGRLVRERLEHGSIPGSRFRNVRTVIVLRRLVTRRVAFPAYVMAYRYRGRLYRFVLSGQEPTCLLGAAPYSPAKILLAVSAGVLGVLLLLMMMLAILL